MCFPSPLKIPQYPEPDKTDIIIWAVQELARLSSSEGAASRLYATYEGNYDGQIVKEQFAPRNAGRPET